MAFFFPDNTVLINFAHCGQVGLLAQLLPERRRHWTASVASECERSARIPGLESLRDAAGIFGSPLWPTPAEQITALSIRIRHFAQPGDPPWKHLGEAETIAVIDRRFPGSVFITDDTSVAPIAASQAGAGPPYSFTAITTWDLFKVALKKGLCTEADVLAWRQLLLDAGRGCPRHVRDVAQFTAWLRS